MQNNFKTAAAIETLKARAQIIRKIRQFFDDEGFFEVETPLLSHDIVVDRYLEPISISGKALGLTGIANQKFWLQTSPEFGMKRILASGADAIYQICKAFRSGERGQFHNPEFTMLEWYRIQDSMAEGIERLGRLATQILNCKRFETISYSDAFENFASCNILSDDVNELESCAQSHNLDFESLTGCKDLDSWRNLLLTHLVEPNLGSDNTPTIVYDWPASQSALAIVRDDVPPVAERFELYFRGIELANGYHELIDANELASRNRTSNNQRTEDGKSPLPETSGLLDAMRSGLPNCCGVALGIDRLVMLATENKSIDDVLSFTIENC